MTFNRDDPTTWPQYDPLIIAHDVGRSRDRSTAVVGGVSYFKPSLIGIRELQELPQNLYGSARASALAEVDRKYRNNALIVVDLSNDPTYAETMLTTFGPRVIGLHIGRFGDGLQGERRPVGMGWMPVYTVGRSYLLQLLLSELQAGQVKMVDDTMSQRAFAQLMGLETEYRETGIVYKCPPGQHDDLGISCAMVVWAAKHPHLSSWAQIGLRRHVPVSRPPPISSQAWT